MLTPARGGDMTHRVEYDIAIDRVPANGSSFARQRQAASKSWGQVTLANDHGTSHAVSSRCDHETVRTTQLSLLIGILSAPANRERRASIRASWLEAASGRDGGGALGCFVIGVGEGEPTQQALRSDVQREAAVTGDVWRLASFAETGQIRKIKTFLWWTAVAKLLEAGATFEHAVKTDDDALVYVPNLMGALSRYTDTQYLCLGKLAFTSYGPSFRRCGWTWGPLKSAWGLYKDRKCASKGNPPPFPFAVGMLQLVSSPLVRELAATQGAAEFYRRADARVPRNSTHYYDDAQEDITFGYWLSVAQRERRFSVRYVHLPEEESHNIGCTMAPNDKQSDMYRRISDARTELVLHGLKRPAGMGYAWDVLSGRIPPNTSTCKCKVWGVLC